LSADSVFVRADAPSRPRSLNKIPTCTKKSKLPGFMRKRPLSFTTPCTVQCSNFGPQAEERERSREQIERAKDLLRQDKEWEVRPDSPEAGLITLSI